MNNVLPRALKMHYKYDLKGSSYKRRASRKERAKTSPTFKDLDFQEMHDGLHFDSDTYGAMMKTLQRDCRVSPPPLKHPGDVGAVRRSRHGDAVELQLWSTLN